MQAIDRDTTRSMVEKDDGATVIEVLSQENFEKFHLPGAQNVPLDEKFDEKIQAAVPDKSQPVVLYCFDEECSASPKAAQRMDELGYQQVYDYEAGKRDWKEAGLPVET